MKIQVGLTGPVGRDSLYDLVRGWGGERNGDSIGPSQPEKVSFVENPSEMVPDGS